MQRSPHNAAGLRLNDGPWKMNPEGVRRQGEIAEHLRGVRSLVQGRPAEKPIPVAVRPRLTVVWGTSNADKPIDAPSGVAV
jgi:hypothetical protein